MKALSFMIKTVLPCAATNVYALAMMYTHGAAVAVLTVLAAIFIIALSIYPCTSKEKGWLGRLHRGNYLMKIFLFAVTVGIVFNGFIGIKGGTWQNIGLNCLFAFLGLALMFSISVIRLYTSSVQLGIKWRVLGAVFAFFPVVNIIILLCMVRLADSEYKIECQLAELDRSRAVSASGGRFPLNFSYHLVKYFDGPNDGLVSVDAMKWGDSFHMIEPEGHRGVAHADVIDLNCENIKGFDVRKFYIVLVNDLKKKGGNCIYNVSVIIHGFRIKIIVNAFNIYNFKNISIGLIGLRQHCD